MNHHK